MRPYQALLPALVSLLVMAARPADSVEIEVIERPDGSALIIRGTFESSDDPARLLALVQSHRPDLITFDSSGGSIYAAMAFGRAIRRTGIATAQPRFLECASACALAFFGGVSRSAEPGSIGVHKTSFSPGTALSRDSAVSAVQGATADVIQYMIEMGIDPGLLQFTLRYESWDMRYLSASEMAQHGVVTSATARSPVPAGPTAPPASASAPGRQVSLADASNGQVRHPAGQVSLMSRADPGSVMLATLGNGERVAILTSLGDWYQVRSSEGLGYLHHSWVQVDQFHRGPPEARYIQIMSYATAAETQSYLERTALAVDVFRATTGWFAVTLAGTFPLAQAKASIERLKGEGRIPEDSFATYGNTYMQKVCCD